MSLSTKKWLYGIASALAPIVGTICGVLGGFVFAVAYMYQPDKGEILELKEHGTVWTNAVNYISENGAKNFVGEYSVWMIGAAILFTILVVGLCILSGQFNRNEDNTIKMNWFDSIWTELQLAVFTVACVGAVCCAAPFTRIVPAVKMFDFYNPVIANEYVFDPIPNQTVLGLCTAAMLVLIEIAILLFVSMVKKLKAKRFLDTALLGKAVIALVNGIKNIWDKTTLPDDDNGHASNQLRLKYIAIPIGMVLLAMTWIGAVVDVAIILAIVPNKIKKYLEIRKGVAEVKSGDLSYQINVDKNPRNEGYASDFDKLAEDINQITAATNTAVQSELKNQRMKTDLISNVSHDLKTPLTSMISYLDILKKEGLDSPNAQEYLNIVDEKTQKLKTLTEDLFEAAKASSGNIPCDITDIDLVQMLEQELAEMADVLAERELEVIRTIKVERDAAMVKADGRLLSRVIENILGNVGKYALNNSRVYVDVAEETGNRLRLDVKNISRDQLNISPEELMERFTRGDDSRNTEGSGLGLAIAKDLTSLMGGTFTISIDGDMFKATVLLPR